MAADVAVAGLRACDDVLLMLRAKADGKHGRGCTDYCGRRLGGYHSFERMLIYAIVHTC